MAEEAKRPTIVTLCGSTRFYEAFQRANFEETMAGKIVLSVGFYPHAQEEMHGEAVGVTAEQKSELDQIHLQKIQMGDEVLVLNVGGYVGESTQNEICFAIAARKRIRFLENMPEGDPPYTWDQLEAIGLPMPCLDALYDAQVADIADCDDGQDDPHGHGKRLPYIGWFWRELYWADLRIPIGDAGELVGPMMSNKWGYPERRMTRTEAHYFRHELDHVFQLQRAGGDIEAPCAQIWNWMQGLRNKGKWAEG
jgi:co-chaperonin GroES (HSP10)